MARFIAMETIEEYLGHDARWRSFVGIDFVLGFATTKKHAERTAAHIRRLGFNARITMVYNQYSQKMDYLVWVRPTSRSARSRHARRRDQADKIAAYLKMKRNLARVVGRITVVARPFQQVEGKVRVIFTRRR